MVANPEVLQMGTDQFRCQLTVRRRDRDDGAAGHSCGSSTFIHVDMSGLGAQDAIKRTGHGLQGHGVRPRPVKHEKRRSILAEHFLYLTRSGLCPRIITISNRMIIICLDDRIHYPGMHAGIVVTSETSHLQI